MDFLYLIFCGCLRLRFLDVETNPGPLRPGPGLEYSAAMSAKYSAAMCGAWPGTLVT